MTDIVIGPRSSSRKGPGESPSPDVVTPRAAENSRPGISAKTWPELPKREQLRVKAQAP
jgi:hypothetical protein